jgi:mannosyltransferase OCH1-like enzyme
MIKYLSLLGLFLSTVATETLYNEKKWLATDFEEYLIKAWQPGYAYQTFYHDPLWKLYSELYVKKMPLNKSAHIKIPKKIHQIWLGSEFPECFKPLQKTWIDKHPDWEYKLWTDKDAELFEFENKDLFRKATNYGEKSDILRYEILHRFGGLYIDVDFECLQSFDILHRSFDFFTGLPGWRALHLANGLIACIPGHPIMRECIAALRHNYETPPTRDDGNFGIFDRSGPYYFTECFKKIAPTIKDHTIVLPGTYFYPLPPLDNRDERRPDIASLWVQPESFCVHYWSSSWLKQW